jgi:DNA-binding CsgD family transcriptional regulator
MAELASEIEIVVRPGALSRDATALVLRRLGDPEPALIDACHRATGGNPFYVRAVVDELEQGSATPTPAAVEQLSPQAVALALVRRLAGLPAGATAIARATAILGDGADRDEAQTLMALDVGVMERAVAALVRAEILAPGERLAFIHPIARAAIYGEIDDGERAALHARAALIRQRAGQRPDHVAAQLMLAAPGAVERAVDVLRAAARHALDRGAPDVAAAYLRRALHEPVDDDRYADLAAALGGASARAGLPEADADFRRAFELAPDDERRAAVALELARLLSVMGRSTEAIDVLRGCAVRCADAPPASLERMRAELLAIGDMDLAVRPQALGAAGQFPVHSDARDDTVAAMLLAHQATEVMMRCASAHEAAELARQALATGALVSAGVAGIQLSFLAAYFLMCADHYAEAAGFFDHVLDVARRTGSAAGFASASAWRSILACRRGDLLAAEADARAAVDTSRAIGLQSIEYVALTALCFTLLERDQPQHAARELEDAAVDPRAIGSLQAAAVLEARGRVRLALRDTQGGVEDMLESGRRFRETGLDNPASFAWRSGAAPALAVLGRHDEARTLAHEETMLASQWGAPRPLGAALRIEGTLSNDADGRALLYDAVAVLEGSPAALERARAVIELGAALRRTGRRREARPLLHEGLELAQACMAPRDAARARTELRAAGGRARTPMRTGLDALTPSEHRIAALAAEGRSNPEIAQDLFVTKKTVEMHLSAVYRKLAIRSRSQLARVLAG